MDRQSNHKVDKLLNTQLNGENSMNASQISIAIAIATLAILAVLLYRKGWRKVQKRLTPLAGLAFGFVLAGIIFHDGSIVPYTLLGIGVVLSAVDMINQTRRRKPDNASGSSN
jgi:hypothetical protein